MEWRCRCECGRQFYSDDPDAWICQKCSGDHDRAVKDTNDMPAPKLEDRPWSTSWMKERLGVNGREDV
jgi:hypothetical protein